MSTTPRQMDAPTPSTITLPRPRSALSRTVLPFEEDIANLDEHQQAWYDMYGKDDPIWSSKEAYDKVNRPDLGSQATGSSRNVQQYVVSPLSHARYNIDKELWDAGFRNLPSKDRFGIPNSFGGSCSRDAITRCDFCKSSQWPAIAIHLDGLVCKRAKARRRKTAFHRIEIKTKKYALLPTSCMSCYGKTKKYGKCTLGRRLYNMETGSVEENTGQADEDSEDSEVELGKRSAAAALFNRRGKAKRARHVAPTSNGSNETHRSERNGAQDRADSEEEESDDGPKVYSWVKTDETFNILVPRGDTFRTLSSGPIARPPVPPVDIDIPLGAQQVLFNARLARRQYIAKLVAEYDAKNDPNIDAHVNAVVQAASQAMERCEGLQSQVDNLVKEKAELVAEQASCGLASIDLVACQEELFSARKEAETARTEMDLARAEAGKAQSEAETSRTALDDARKASSSSFMENKVLKRQAEENKGVKAELEAAETRIRALREELQDKDGLVDLLQGELIGCGKSVEEVERIGK